MSEQPTLFDEGDPSDAGLRERVDVARRYRATLLRGWHPISGHQLHLYAAPMDDKQAEGLRCRDCFFAIRAPEADVFKCALDSGRYVDHSPNSDLRLWSPACTAHLRDTPLSEQR